MSVLKYILPALAVVGSASAACSVAATTTIQNAGDASAIATCSTFSGSIAIATGTTDNINIPSVRRITGDLTASNVTQLTTLGADTLDTIDGTFSLESMTILSSLSFPRLATVGIMRWSALPGLQSLSFATGVQKANEVNIQNTQLQSLDGINLQTVATFYIANNNFLSRMSLQLANVSNTFTVEANGGQDPVDVVLPNLIWANNMTFRNCNTISIPSLQALNGSMGFFSGGFDSLSAANLTTVGGSLIFSDNSNMANISMPMLTRIDGGFTIGKNPQYKQVNGFPNLQTIVGALDFSGNFTSVSLPALKDVRGAFNIQASGDISNDCNHFNSIKGSNSVIKGKYTCAGSQSRPGGANTTPTGTSSSSTATKTGAASHMGVSSGAVVGLAGVLAAMLGMF